MIYSAALSIGLSADSCCLWQDQGPVKAFSTTPVTRATATTLKLVSYQTGIIRFFFYFCNRNSLLPRTRSRLPRRFAFYVAHPIRSILTSYFVLSKVRATVEFFDLARQLHHAKTEPVDQWLRLDLEFEYSPRR